MAPTDFEKKAACDCTKFSLPDQILDATVIVTRSCDAVMLTNGRNAAVRGKGLTGRTRHSPSNWNDKVPLATSSVTSTAQPCVGILWILGKTAALCPSGKPGGGAGIGLSEVLYTADDAGATSWNSPPHLPPSV